MTSAKTEQKHSKAFRDLQIGLGKERSNLSKMHPSELEGLLEEQLYQIRNYDISHFCGFTELHETLSQKNNDGKGSVVVSEKAIVNCKGFDEKYPFDLKSHTVKVWQGFVWQKRTWRRNESGEESSDFKVSNNWDNGGYLYKCNERIILIRRVLGSAYKEPLVVEVTYEYLKVPNKKEYVVNSIDAELIPVDGFCKHFGKKSGKLADSIFNQLRTLYGQTANDLKSKSNQMQARADQLSRFTEVVTS